MSNDANESSESGRRKWLAAQPWLVFVFPLAVFMLAGMFEPKPTAEPTEVVGLSVPYSAYPLVYSIKIALTLVALWFVWPGLKQFPLKVSMLAVAVGIVGAVIWVGLATLHLEPRVLKYLGLDRFLDLGQRSAFNPLVEMADRPALAWAFLAVRFFGLVVVIALAEELFLRGFLMRFFARPDWWNVAIGDVNTTAVVVGTAFPMLMHPGELLAAAVWFSMVTWLMVRTRNLWDCVVAHGVTNLLLGLYVVYSGHWELM